VSEAEYPAGHPCVSDIATARRLPCNQSVDPCVGGGVGQSIKRPGAGGELLLQLTAGPDAVPASADLLSFAPVANDYCVQQLP